MDSNNGTSNGPDIDNTNNYSKNTLSVDSKEKLSAEIDEIKTLRVSFNNKSDGPTTTTVSKSG